MKHLLDIPGYDDRAFIPSFGRMRLYGKSSAPPSPDYIGQANATAAGNLEAARATTAANRVDQVTPYGSIKYTNGRSFDQSGYDAAVAKYQADLASAQSQRQSYLNQKSGGQVAPSGSMQYGDENVNINGREYLAGGSGVLSGNGGTPGGVTSQGLDSFMALPKEVSRDDYYSGDPDRWSSEIQLSETGQQLLDAANKTQLGLAGLQGTAMDRVKESQSQPFDTSGLIDINSQTGMDAWAKASQLIKDRQNPGLDSQQAALDAKLANQGLTAGSEGWGLQQTQFGKQRNDADIAAEMAGLSAQNQFFNQGIAGNQATLQQRSFLRNMPLNELNALRTGSQVTNPTFANAPAQGQTQGADLLGASGQQYNAALGQTNAANQASANTTAGVVGAIGTALSFY